MPIIYDEYMNEIGSTDDNGDNTVANDQKGMAALTHPSPITEMKTETIPDAIQQRMSGAITSRTVGGDDIVSASTNPMMVNTMIPQSKDAAIGMPDNYDPPLDPIATADDVVQGILETDDLVTVESFLGKLTHALEAMGYEPPKPDQLDPNQPVDLALLMDEVQYVDDSALRADERIAAITELREEIQDIGGVTRDIAYAVENLRPSIITSKVALERFTRIPSKTNRGVVEAALEDLVVAASITGLVVIVYAIIKVIKWIIDRIEHLRYDVKTDSIRGQYVRLYTELNRTLVSRGKDISNKLIDTGGMDAVGTALCNAFEKMGIDPNDLAKDIVSSNNRFINTLFERLIGKSYCELDKGLYTGDTFDLCKYTFITMDNAFENLTVMFDRVKSKPDSELDLNMLENFVTNMTNLKQLYKLKSNDTEDLMADLNNHIQLQMKPIMEEPPRVTDSLTHIQFKMDVLKVNPSIPGKLRSMIRQATTWESQLKEITDDNLRQNRKAALSILLKQTRIVAGLLQANKSLMDRPIVYISYMNQSITRNARMWNQAFKAYGIKEVG